MEPIIYGVWGGKGPGGWCHIYKHGVDLHKGNRYIGTLEQANFTAKDLKNDYPSNPYEVCVFDPGREPVATIPPKLTEPQRTMLERVKATGDHINFGYDRRGTRATFGALMDRGLIMSNVLGSGMKITKAGLEALDRELHKEGCGLHPDTDHQWITYECTCKEEE